MKYKYSTRKFYMIPLVLGIICLFGVFSVGLNAIVAGGILILIGVWPSIKNIPVNKMQKELEAEREAKRPEVFKLADIQTKTLLNMKDPNEDYSMTKKELKDIDYTDDKIYQYEFVVDPELRKDGNGIKVFSVGDEDVYVGQIADEDVEAVSALMDSGKITGFNAEVTGGKYKLLKDDYDDDKDKDVYTLETGEDPYEITLSIYIDRTEKAES